MSPIYDSISKVNYYSTYTAEELREAQKAKIIDSKVMALGVSTKTTYWKLKISVLGELSY